LITIPHDISVVEAMGVLHKNKILAGMLKSSFLPLLAMFFQEILTCFLFFISQFHVIPHHSIAAPVLNSDGTCAGSIDVLSMLSYSVSSDRGSSSQLWSQIKDLSVGTVSANVIERKRLISFFSENPVSMLIDLFGTGVHRVALFHPNNELIATLSQSGLFYFSFYDHQQILAGIDFSVASSHSFLKSFIHFFSSLRCYPLHQ